MRRIRQGEIGVGEPLKFNCYDAHGTLLLKRGLLITSEHQLVQLIERGLFQDIQEGGQVATAAPERTSPFRMLDEFRARLAAIFLAFDRPEAATIPERVKRLCEDIQALCRYDADAALGDLHLDHDGRYGIMHPLHVAILCELIAERVGLPDDDRQSLLAAALTANVAMLELQDSLQKQSTALTPAQLRAIRAHPLESADMLLRAGVADEAWIKAVLHHHERLDGSGYPGAMRGEYIPVTVRILSLADTYSAMITPRHYRGTIHAKDALRAIFLKRGSEMDAELAQLFIHELSVYPPGAFVRLKNGETAVVIRRGKAATSPLVKSVLGPHGALLPHPVPRDCGQAACEIDDMVPRDRRVPLDLHALWGYD